MKYLLLMLFAVLLSAELFAERPKVIVDVEERDSSSSPAPFQYLPATDSSGPRIVIDPGEMVYQMTLDSINKTAEEKIREQIQNIE